MIDKLQKAVDLYGFKGIHPAANLMPMMSDNEYAELISDIKQNGFIHPVRVTSELLVIDGRNRLCASIDAGKDCDIETYNPIDPIQYVLSENLQRRHLTAGQRAMIATEIELLYAEEAKKRQAEAGTKNLQTYKDESLIMDNCPQLINEESKPKLYREPPKICSWKSDNKSSEKAGKAVGISGKSVQRAKKLKSENPELAAQVSSGELSLNKAVEIVKEQEKAEEFKTDPAILLQVESANKSNCKFNETTDSIEWAKYTWNPVTGCKMGCVYCYARDIANRFNGGFEPKFHKDRLSAPENTKCKAGYPNNVFVCSMADLFGEWIPAEWIEKVLQIVRDNPQWNFLFLTKNPKRYLEFVFPDNCWLGATADNQSRADHAIAAFNNMDSKHIHFLSCEPLLESIDISQAKNLQWLIIGGQSKTSGAEASQPDWLWVERLIVKASQFNIPYYFKPNLTIRPKELPK